MSSRPGYYAVPGSIWPGDMEPGRAGTLAFSEPGVSFSLGTACLRWAAGTPYLDWSLGTPYL